ncbi:MAG TPA: tRNA lysidine(34) synthetase TilS [Steroidobacteraceae bacterium]|nr:tRNA lysidine(34) synthetase TilS [Steroidobacteraceae bacterium]
MTFSPEVLARHLAPLIGESRPQRLAVALSGGADSAALLHAVAALAGADPGLTVRAIHVDHGLSAAAAPLAAAAAAVAAATRVPLCSLTVVVDTGGGLGIEAAARAARYAALASALEPGECLLSAHHREDQAETLLTQLLRGAGLKGLAAMPAAATLGGGRLLRPLLEVPRRALRAYALAARLPFSEDPMNADVRFDRAYLRRELWPILTGRWPEAARTIARTAGHLARAQALLDQASAEQLAHLARGPALSIAGLLELPEARRAELLRYWLGRLGLPAPPARRLAVVERELLSARGTGGPRMAWDGCELRAFAGLLYAFAPLPDAPVAGQSLPPPGTVLPLGARGALGALEITATLGEGLALGHGGQYVLGRRAGGERLALARGAPRRALKDLLRESRLPPWARERALLVGGGTLAAVVLPHATWVAAEHAAGALEPGLKLVWRGAPPVMMPAPAASNCERDP